MARPTDAGAPKHSHLRGYVLHLLVSVRPTILMTRWGDFLGMATNLEALETRGIDAYVTTGRAKYPTSGKGANPRISAMREKIKAGGYESPYRLRKQLPEPVFGQIKQARGFTVPDAGDGEGPCRVGHGLHRPQHSETGRCKAGRRSPDRGHSGLPEVSHSMTTTSGATYHKDG
jgi:hypothetical protein